MIDVLFLIIVFIFGMCMVFLYYIAELFNISYSDISVYFNLYFQYFILLLSCLSVLRLSVSKIIKQFSMKRLITLICVSIYNILIIILGFWIYKRYATISTDDAFFLCRRDLLDLSSYISVPTQSMYYYAGWTEYFIVNILIFIVGFLFIIILNQIIKKYIKRYI